MEDKDKLIVELKAENERLKEDVDFYNKQLSMRVVLYQKYSQALTEIKAIAEMDICSNCITQKREDNCQCLADTILQLITKAEEE